MKNSSLRDGGRFAEMLLFHGNPAASVADIFHGCEFAFANMGRIHLWSTAKTALLLVSAWIAQVTRIVCHCTAIFTSVRHFFSPFQPSGKHRFCSNMGLKA
jgi:hypothetical protein